MLKVLIFVICVRSPSRASYISIKIMESIIMLVMCVQSLEIICYLKIRLHIQSRESPFPCYVCKKFFIKQNTLNRYLFIYGRECLFASKSTHLSLLCGADKLNKILFA